MFYIRISNKMESINNKINIVNNYPYPGIIFRDISPLLLSTKEKMLLIC